MTVMTRAEAREAEHYDSIRHLIPDWESTAHALMEDYAIPAEFEGRGFEDKHDVANAIEDAVVEEIRDASVPRDAQHFVDREVEEAREYVYAFVMEGFDELAEETGLEY